MMHQVAHDALREQFLAAASCAGKPGADRAFFLARADEVLDEFNSYRLYATEWDADQWGLDPDNWMRAERAELRRRAGGARTCPREACDA